MKRLFAGQALFSYWGKAFHIGAKRGASVGKAQILTPRICLDGLRCRVEEYHVTQQSLLLGAQQPCLYGACRRSVAPRACRDRYPGYTSAGAAASCKSGAGFAGSQPIEYRSQPPANVTAALWDATLNNPGTQLIARIAPHLVHKYRTDAYGYVISLEDKSSKYAFEVDNTFPSG